MHAAKTGGRQMIEELAFLVVGVRGSKIETTGEKYFFWYLLAVGGSMGCRWHSDEGWLDSSRPHFSLHCCQKSIKHLPALTWLLYFNKIDVLPSHYVAPQQIYHELKWYLFIDRHTINLQSLNSSGLKKLGPPGGLHRSTPCSKFRPKKQRNTTSPPAVWGLKT